MLRILDPPMTPNRFRQELRIRLQAAEEVPYFHRLLLLAVHHRDDTTDTPEVAPGRAIPQLLGDRCGEIGPVLRPAAILLLRGMAPGAGQDLLVLEHPVEVVGEVLIQMGL